MPESLLKPKLPRDRNRILAVASIFLGFGAGQVADNIWIGMGVALGLYCGI